MSEYIIARTGTTPLKLHGEVVATSNAPEDACRGHRLTAYRTTAGAYVAEIKYRTTWKDELPYTAAYAGTLPEIVDYLEHHEINYVRGYPASDRFAGRQTRLLADIKAQYLQQVSELLAAIDGAIEVVD